MVEPQNNDYFMEHQAESHRLAQKVDPEFFLEKYLLGHIAPENTVLELACGPGVILNTAAEATPTTQFFGVDYSGSRIHDAYKLFKNTKNCTAIFGDALNLPFQSNCFDFVFTRFLFQYLRNPKSVLSEMIRVCRPHGKIFVQDLDGQLQWCFPEDSYLKEQIDKVVEYLKVKTGFDPFAGRKLFYHFCSFGLENIQVRADSYNLSWGRMDKLSYELWKTKLDITTPYITKALGSRYKADIFKNDILNYFHSPETIIYSIVFTVFGNKPGNDRV